MTEFIKEILATFKTRMKNPFLGAFTISFTVFNWKPISIYLFSSEKMEERIHYIKHVYPSPECYQHVWIPLIFAGIYVFIIPYISLFFNQITKHSTDKKREVEKVKYVDDKTAEQTRAQADFDLEQVKSGFKNQEQLNIEIKNLKNTIADKDLTIETEKDEYNSLKTEYIEFKNGSNQKIDELEKNVKHYKHKLSLETIDKNRYKNDASVTPPKRIKLLGKELNEALIIVSENQGIIHPIYSIIDENLTNELIEKGYIEKLKNNGSGEVSMVLTKKGERILSIK